MSAMSPAAVEASALPFKSFFSRLRLRRRRGLREWMEQELTIPEGAARGRLFNVRTRPWVGLVLEASSNHRRILIAACPRAGKSLYGIGPLLCRLCEYGESVHLLAPDERTAADFFATKIERILMDNPRLAALLPVGYSPKASTTSILRLRNGGILRIVYNPDNIRSYDASCLLVTEASQFHETPDEPDAITLAERRQDDHPGGGLKIIESTHTRDTVRFARDLRAGTDSRLQAPCPHCGAYFEPGRREHLRGWEVGPPPKEAARDGNADGNGGDAPPAPEEPGDGEVAQAAPDPHQVCPHCDDRIDESHRPAMVAAGRLEPTNPNAADFSVTVNWFWTSRTFAEVAAAESKFKASKELVDLRDLCQTYYAVPVTEEMEAAAVRVEAKTITRAGILERKGGYPSGDMGQFPPTIKFRVGAIDVQQAWLYWVVLGFGTDLSTFWLDWGVVEIVPYELQKSMTATPDMFVGALDACMARLERFRIQSVWLDVNYKAEASDVPIIRRWGAERPGLVRMLMGRGDTQFARMNQVARELPPAVRDFLEARVQPEGDLLWFPNVDRIKSNLLNRFLYPPKSPGSCYFPDDVAEKKRDWLIRHLMGERPQVVDTKSGPVLRWSEKGCNGRHDLLDCSAYAYVGGLLYAAAKGYGYVAPARPAAQRPAARPQPHAYPAGPRLPGSFVPSFKPVGF